MTDLPPELAQATAPELRPRLTSAASNRGDSILQETAGAEVLTRLLTEEGVCARFSTIYPSRHSLKWAIRRHRERLVQLDALFIINGRNWFDPIRFAQAIVDAGHLAALVSTRSGDQSDVAGSLIASGSARKVHEI